MNEEDYRSRVHFSALDFSLSGVRPLGMDPLLAIATLHVYVYSTLADHLESFLSPIFRLEGFKLYC